MRAVQPSRIRKQQHVWADVAMSIFIQSFLFFIILTQLKIVNQSIIYCSSSTYQMLGI